MQTNVTPGLLILHGNQLEQLRAAVFQWLRSHPLAPLETDIFLVQSNGVAEWLKIALAEEMGICAATRIALPARLLWESYRGMLGRERVPRVSPFDKSPLTWRLMRLLPSLLDDAVFAPLRYFLADGDAERRLQLADLFDQYQVYRADWLADWAAGRDQLRTARNEAIPLKHDQRWQAQLWRAVAADVPENERRTGRADIHDAFLAAIAAGEAPAGKLPRRVVLFGVSALPYQTLQALAALARYTQVVLAVPNPCQFYWGDIIEGRDLLRAAINASSSATAPTWRRYRSKNCMRTAIRCWQAGAGKGVTSSACSMNSMKARPPKGATTACASTCLARKRARPCCNRCRSPSANCVRWPNMKSCHPRRRTARSNFTWRIACSAKSKCCTTSCWPCLRTAPKRACARAT